MGMMPNLLRWRRRKYIGPAVIQFLMICGVDIPPEVEIGEDLTLWHRGQGVVIAPRTRIGDRVHVFHQVTIGGKDPTLRHDKPQDWEGVVIADDVILCAGAKVLAGRTLLTVGRGTIVAANAVLLHSTGEYEIWGGMPARRIGIREPEQRNTRPGVLELAPTSEISNQPN